MGRTLTKEEIFQMSVPERLELIESIWDSIAPDQLPVPDSHRRALDAALQEHEREPQVGRPWEQVRDDLFGKR